MLSFLCTNLTSVSIPGSVTAIKEHTFEECTNLESVKMANGITLIDEHAFYNCIYNHRTTKTNQKYPSVNL